MDDGSSPSQEGPAKADARPTKAFFVSMITRDISLEESILDLIDNSADAALRREKSRPVGLTGQVPLGKYSVDVRLSEDDFLIADTCGGLSLDDAAHYAFTFGRRSDAPPSPFTVGVYGIGLKRAVFKIGRDIRIVSTYRLSATASGPAPAPESFAVPIDVDDWLAAEGPVWDFDIEESPPEQHAGVRIRICRLGEPVSQAFCDPSFVASLRHSISTAYALHISNGLTIRLNGKDVESFLPSFMQASSILPARVSSTDSEVPDVSLELIAGMTQPPSDDPAPDPDVVAQSKFGWYVACNGRFVVVADRTPLTGWGVHPSPHWHQQYAGFVGFALFSSPDPSLLPLTTTKRRLDVSSDVYRRAQATMDKLARQWINYTNRRKRSLQSARRQEKQASSVSISDIKPRPTLKLPKLAAERPEASSTVTYRVSSRRVVALAQELGNPRASPNTVGKDAFEYCYRDLIDDSSAES